VYNQNGYFSLAYAMRVSIFIILGAIDWASNFILFYGVDAECDCAAEGERRILKQTYLCIVLGTRPGMINKSPVIL